MQKIKINKPPATMGCYTTMADTPTPLHKACRDGNYSSVEGFRRLIEENPEALTKQDNRHGSTPLY
jgi:hypothetical protein